MKRQFVANSSDQREGQLPATVLQNVTELSPMMVGEAHLPAVSDPHVAVFPSRYLIDVESVWPDPSYPPPRS